jgi:hypothetical protein
MAGGRSTGFGVKFFNSLLQEFVGMRAGDEVFVGEKQSGDSLEAAAIGFLAIGVDNIGECGILEGGGDSEGVETGNFGKAMNVARRFNGVTIQPVVVHGQEMKGIAPANGGGVRGSDMRETSTDVSGAGPEFETKFGKDTTGNVVVFASNARVSRMWQR